MAKLLRDVIEWWTSAKLIGFVGVVVWGSEEIVGIIGAHGFSQKAVFGFSSLGKLRS